MCISDITSAKYSLATIPKKCRGECWVCALPLARLVAGAGRSLVDSSIGLEHATPPDIPTVHLTHFQTCMPGRASRHAPVCVCQDSTQRARTTAGLVRREHTMALVLPQRLRLPDDIRAWKTNHHSVSVSIFCVVRNQATILPGSSGYPYLAAGMENHWNVVLLRVYASRMPGRRRRRCQATMSPSLRPPQPQSSSAIPLSFVQDVSQCGPPRSFSGQGLRSCPSV